MQSEKDLARLRDLVLEADNLNCFIERETLLREHAAEIRARPQPQWYIAELELLLGNLSTPLDPCDKFAGRMVEGRWPHADGFTCGGLIAEGHITLPMPKVLRIGLDGIAAEVAENARRINSDEARFFADCTARAVGAIRSFCRRYADAADAAGKPEMAKALRTVPCQPAYDFFSALQSTWMMQFVCSAVIGSRDFAPGRMDQYLADYLGDTPREQAVELLAFFMVKFNEVAGTATDNYATKPTPCFASKQYITLGPDFNAISGMIVEAAEAVKLPQPTLNFRLRDDFALAGCAAHALDAQCNFFNDKLIHAKLLNAGIRPEDAAGYSFTACNRVDLPGKLNNIMRRIDRFDNSTSWFREALVASADETEITGRLFDIARREIIRDMRENVEHIFSEAFCFRFESLFLDSCVQSCRDIYRGGCDQYRWLHRMFSGIANMADSMAAIMRLRKRLPYSEILKIIEADFAGHEALLREIRETFPKFGNADPEVDSWASKIANTLIDAFESAARQEGFTPMPSLYSLTRHHDFGKVIGALPDGRRAGEQISENQSPVHGMDRKGPTALLRSVASLPQERCICGGLNMKFATRQEANVLEALVKTFFGMGGLHIGFSMVDRRTLEDARERPNAHRTLLVRKTGFSEFFISLSPAEQQEIIDRTEY